jgi:lipoprotein-anchoring transpeptidase ErfK/SrfK
VFRRTTKVALAKRGIRATQVKVAVGLLAAATMAVSVGWLLATSGGPPRPQARPPRAAPARPAVRHGPTATPSALLPATATVATVVRSTLGYASPGQVGKDIVPASWYGRPSVLPVIGTQPGWVRVRIAQRPNGSTAWLPDSDVKLGSTPYRIVVHTATMHLALYKHGKLVFSAPAGVGTADDPTPLGEYFVAFDEPPPNPGYGAFIMVTSAHSSAIQDWEGSGDAVIGIHGPLGMDTAIGTTGARVSHGCIRLHDQALDGLSKVPPGTPIDVVG